MPIQPFQKNDSSWKQPSRPCILCRTSLTLSQRRLARSLLKSGSGSCKQGRSVTKQPGGC